MSLLQTNTPNSIHDFPGSLHRTYVPEDQAATDEAVRVPEEELTPTAEEVERDISRHPLDKAERARQTLLEKELGILAERAAGENIPWPQA